MPKKNRARAHPRLENRTGPNQQITDRSPYGDTVVGPSFAGSTRSQLPGRILGDLPEVVQAEIGRPDKDSGLGKSNLDTLDPLLWIKIGL